MIAPLESATSFELCLQLGDSRESALLLGPLGLLLGPLGESQSARGFFWSQPRALAAFIVCDPKSASLFSNSQVSAEEPAVEGAFTHGDALEGARARSLPDLKSLGPAA
jgi:hypothetical protein